MSAMQQEVAFIADQETGSTGEATDGESRPKGHGIVVREQKGVRRSTG